MREQTTAQRSTQAKDPDAMAVVAERDADTAMQTLAALYGDARAAAKVLWEMDGQDVSPELLESMRKGSHRGVYTRHADVLAPHLEDAIVREMREVAGRSLQLERRLLSKIEKDLDDGQVQDPAKALTAVSKTKQTSVDKLLALTGRPTTITETRDAAQIVKKLEALRVLIPIEATAEDA